MRGENIPLKRAEEWGVIPRFCARFSGALLRRKACVVRSPLLSPYLPLKGWIP